MTVRFEMHFKPPPRSQNTRPRQPRNRMRRSKLATLKPWQKPRFSSTCTLRRRLAPTRHSERYWRGQGPITSSGRLVVGTISPRPDPHKTPTKVLGLIPTWISRSLRCYLSTPFATSTNHHRRAFRMANVIPSISFRGKNLKMFIYIKHPLVAFRLQLYLSSCSRDY